MAEGGLKYNRFHVTALCSPTRAALLTGRNSHTVGVGSVGEFAGGFPGYSATLPRIVRRCLVSCGTTGTAPRRSASGT
jgi:Arylsulfatase A and related enzymes